MAPILPPRRHRGIGAASREVVARHLPNPCRLDRAASRSSNEKISQPCHGGLIVELNAHARRLLLLFRKIPEPSGGRFRKLGEELKDGGVPTHQLCRMDVPSLINSRKQRVPNCELLKKIATP